MGSTEADWPGGPLCGRPERGAEADGRVVPPVDVQGGGLRLIGRVVPPVDVQGGGL